MRAPLACLLRMATFRYSCPARLSFPGLLIASGHVPVQLPAKPCACGPQCCIVFCPESRVTWACAAALSSKSNNPTCPVRKNSCQALSHFSFHFSNGQHLLCDLQGGGYDTHYVLTDPAVLSVNKDFGVTDGGFPMMRQLGVPHTL